MLAIYCRISKVKRKGEDTSILVQKKNGVLLAKKLGIDYEFFIDEGISGTKDEIEDRPAFARMHKAIKDKKVSAVYVQYQDRLERNPLIWQLFVSIVLKCNCKFYPGGKLLDLDNPQSKFIADIMSASNALYASLTSLRVKDSIKEKAAEGKFRGLCAFGYVQGKDKRLEINIAEADVVKQIFKLSLSGMGTYLIANKLNDEKIPTKFNSFEGTLKRKDNYTKEVVHFEKKDVRWRGNVIYDMLVNPIYKGQKKLNKTFYEVPAIIDEKTWEKVNSNLVNNKKNVGKKAQYKYLLNGLITCSKCGRNFVGKKRLVSGDNAYKCKGKIYPHPICATSRGININKLDSFIIKHLFISKSLKKHLLGLPSNNEEQNGLQLRLTKEKNKLLKQKEDLDAAYKRLLSPAFKDDKYIEKQVLTLKNSVEKQKELVEKIENDLVVNEATNRKRRTSQLINSYVEGADFDDVKKLIHSMIEYIKIDHQKEEEKNGKFLVKIKYRGYEEISTFLTNWQAKKWLWISRYRAGARNNAELENDKEVSIDLMEYYGVEITPKIIREFKKTSGLNDEEINKMNPFSTSFSGLEVVEGMHETIEIKQSEMLYFD